MHTLCKISAPHDEASKNQTPYRTRRGRAPGPARPHPPTTLVHLAPVPALGPTTDNAYLSRPHSRLVPPPATSLYLHGISPKETPSPLNHSSSQDSARVPSPTQNQSPMQEPPALPADRSAAPAPGPLPVETWVRASEGIAARSPALPGSRE